jgi:primase-polymerase (primpol)-like protein
MEFYHKDRFVALTGTGATGNCATDHTAALANVVQRFFPPTSAASVTPADWTTSPCPEWRGPADDQELIRRMMASHSNPFSNKANVQDLWTCNTEVLARTYPSATGDAFDRSSADMALASHLAFWTGKDCARIERLMRMSALKRDKYDRDDYLQQRTIPTAVGGCANVYQERELEVIPEATASQAPTAQLVQGSTFADLDDQVRLFQRDGTVEQVHLHARRGQRAHHAQGV